MHITSLFSKQTKAFSTPALRQITLEVQRVNGINLGQGVCNLPVPEFVLESAKIAANGGHNRYTNPRGTVRLREALSTKLQSFNGIAADPESQILVTCGATGAFEGVCGVLLDPGDEVIVFEPTYPYHIQALNRYQAKVNIVSLSAPDWEIDFDQVKSLVNERTKFILVNTPGNPTGKLFTREEILKLAEIIEPYNCLMVTDEIYEYMTFDGAKHLSPAALPELEGRVITMGGYSKTFSITGWRIGYLTGPAEICASITQFLDAVYACAPAPLQEAVAAGIENFGPEFYSGLNSKYESKRNSFVAGLRNLGLDPLPPAGAYYLICDYSNLFPGLTSYEFVNKMIAETGVGAVPSSDFVRDHAKAQWVRFCLASEDEVLNEALDRLTHLQR